MSKFNAVRDLILAAKEHDDAYQQLVALLYDGAKPLAPDAQTVTYTTWFADLAQHWSVAYFLDDTTADSAECPCFRTRDDAVKLIQHLASGRRLIRRSRRAFQDERVSRAKRNTPPGGADYPIGCPVVLPSLSAAQDLVDFAIRHYFTPEELAEAQRCRVYEKAIAYLIRRGTETLRCSEEKRPPHWIITLPGGMVMIHHPDRPWPAPPLAELHISVLAKQVCPLAPAPALFPSEPERSYGGYRQESFFEDALQTERPREKSRQVGTRRKRQTFLERMIRRGTTAVWSEQKGWVLKDGPLGYVITARPRGSFEVGLIHLPSNREMATVYLDAIDETTRERLQGWVVDALALTDWSRGISAILKEVPGEHKQRTWTRRIEDLWERHRRQAAQRSFYAMGEQE